MRPTKPIEEICKEFNTLRINNQGKEMSRDQIIKELLFILSLSNGSCQKMLPLFEKVGILRVRKDGKAKFYSYPSYPIHIELFKKVRNDFRKSMRIEKRKFQLTEESCISFLKSLGYIISKPSKLNMEKVTEMLGDKLHECYDYEVC